VASTCMCPTPNLARELNTGKRARTIGRNRVRSPELKTMGKKLRSRAGQRVYEHRKDAGGTGVWRAQATAWDAQFRTRGPAKVATEFTLAALAYNLTWLFVRKRALESRRTGGNRRDRKSGTGRMPTTNQFSRTHFERCPPKPEFFSTRGVVPSRIRCVSRVRAANRCLTEARWAS
jgi:hypothetical protein